MSVTILSAASHRRMPWKNGKGETIEIATHPHGAAIEDFDWRISTASVAEDGPFSVFAGVDRNLCVLTGDGIVLTVDGRETPLTQDSAPFAFPGDRPTSARLIGAAITDLNVMNRRGRFAAQVTRLTLDGETTIAPRDTAFLLLTEGQAAIAGKALHPLDCARLDGTATVQGQARLFLIELRPAPSSSQG